jgi:integrase
MVSTTRTREQGKSAASALAARIAERTTTMTTTAPGSNTKAPLMAADVPAVRAVLKASQPAWLLAYFDLSLETGWRTADVANLRYDAINWAEGTVTITVAKQTRAAQTRAQSKGLREVREELKAQAFAAGDFGAYMAWDRATADEVAEQVTEAQVDRIAQLVGSARQKVDTKKISPALLKRLAAMRDAAFWADGFVFSRALTSSNSSRLQSGAAITRQTVWARLRGVFDSLAGSLGAKLSAYSLRKAFAVALYHASGKSLAVVMKAMGHSSEAMSLRYMGMDDEAARLQALMVAA